MTEGGESLRRHLVVSASVEFDGHPDEFEVALTLRLEGVGFHDVRIWWQEDFLAAAASAVPAGRHAERSEGAVRLALSANAGVTRPRSSCAGTQAGPNEGAARGRRARRLAPFELLPGVEE
jgi:hypothetical protein